MITIGITTYNRLSMLRRMAASFYASQRPYPYSIRIYDDASTDYDERVLREIFPDAATIYRHTQNVGSDANIWYMYKDFLKYEDEILFNADSDLIFSQNWMERGIALLEMSDGILSIFNASMHKQIVNQGDIVEKEDVGSAGTFFKHDILEKLINSKHQTWETCLEGLDYQWCTFFKSIGIRICASSNSFVQHIGFEGYNSTMDNFDYGVNYQVDSILNGQLINDALEEKFSKNKPRKVTYALFPFDQVGKGESVVIYGAGATGRDYVAQIENTGYCKVVAVVDRNHTSMKNVQSPENLRQLKFDWIVIAALREDYVMEMRKTIMNISPALAKKIIFKTNRKAIRLY